MIYTTVKSQGEVICEDGMAAPERKSNSAEVPTNWLLMVILSVINFYNVKEGSQTDIPQ